ncbi:MAG: AAA family ATPase, partial [Bacteroidota bacterium]
MARKISFPFYAFRLHFTSGNNLTVPLNDQHTAFFNEPFQPLAEAYAQALEKNLLDKGNYDRLLKEIISGPFQTKSIEIELPDAPDGYTYPAFSMELDYFFTKQNDWFLGLLPSLGIEANGADEVELELNLEQQVQLELKRNNRLGNLHRLFAGIWFDQVELLEETVDLTVYQPWEDANQEDQEQAWLDRVGQKMENLQDPCYGRKRELELLDRYLRNPYNRNLLIVGAHGVGKTALLKEQLQRDGAGQYGPFWETTASQMIKELTRDTGWEDKIAYLIKDWKEQGARLFVQNLSELFEIGQYEGNAVSVAQYLLPYLTRGEVSLVSECTPEERSRIEMKSPNFLGAFQILELEEPRQDLESIIQRKVDFLSQKEGRKLSRQAVGEIVRLNRRYEPYAGFPGRPIRFLENLLLQPGINQQSLDRSLIIRQFSQESGMPQFMIDRDIPMDLPKVHAFFAQQLFGQEQAVDQLVNLLAAIKAGLTQGNKPIASLLFVGPTGVGKTELAKLLSQFMFGDRNRMVRFDMSEYSNPMGVSRLTHRIGDQDGVLTSAVRRSPFTVLLFDEIEKAHVDFFDLLLQILGEGRLTDSQGQLVNFCSTIIIMTSNIGAAALQQQRISPTQRFSTGDLSDHFQNAIKKHFRPEFVNRIDQIIPFQALDQQSIERVVTRELEQLLRREGIRNRRLEIQMDPIAISWLGQHGYSKKYGARYLQRIMREQIATPLAKMINQSDIDDQLIATIKVIDNRLELNIEADPLGLDLLFEELEKINLADFASSTRRSLQNLRNGNYFIRLLSELDILEREKDRSPDEFWANRKKTERYQQFGKVIGSIT